MGPENDSSCTWIGCGGGLGNLQCILPMEASLFVRDECEESN
jgi:hypothetical protein